MNLQAEFAPYPETPTALTRKKVIDKKELLRRSLQVGPPAPLELQRLTSTYGFTSSVSWATSPRLWAAQLRPALAVRHVPLHVCVYVYLYVIIRICIYVSMYRSVTRYRKVYTYICRNVICCFYVYLYVLFLLIFTLFLEIDMCA